MLLPVYGGSRILLYPDDSDVGRFIYYSGLPDYHEMRFVRRYLRPGDHVVDGGAHVGLYTLLLAELVGNEGRVIAYEPMPSVAERLAENVVLNKLRNVDIRQSAVSDSAGDVAFTIDRNSSANRIQTLDTAGNQVTMVSTERLGDLSDLERIVYVKLDLEGAEPLALQGAHPLLVSATPPVWQLEFVDSFMARYGFPAVRVAAWLKDYGFNIVTYDSDRNCFSEAIIGHHTNVLAIAIDRTEEVEDRLRIGETRPTRGRHAARRYG